MNYNPRKIAIAVVAAAAVGLPLTACGSTSGPAVETPTYHRPDCDLGDIEQGDKDCKDPIAFAEAVNKYGSKRVAAAQQKYAEKVAREKLRKKIDGATSRVATPRAKSTRN